MNSLSGNRMMENQELDMLVAENVMGYREHAVHHYWHNAASDEAYDAAERGTYHSFWPHIIPAYSSDMAAAWEVVEKLVGDGKVFIVKGDGLRTGDFNPRWTVLCDNQPRTDASTAPLAICLAALKAVGVELPA